MSSFSAGVIAPGPVVVADQGARAGHDRQTGRCPTALESVTLTRSSACVISRAPESSAIAARVTAPATIGASFSGVMSSVALSATGVEVLSVT